MEREIILLVRRIGFRYEEWLFRDANLTLRAGERICLMGRSGVGKSTLLRILAGLLTPSLGEVKRASPKDGLPAALVFQDARLLPWRKALDNVSFGIESLPISRSKRMDRAHAALEAVGVLELANRYPSQLSGGQKQRVAIARALVTDAPLLLFDEPFSSLDYYTKKELQTLLKRILEEYGKSLICITHDPQDAEVLDADIFRLTPHGLYQGVNEMEELLTPKKAS